MAHKYCPNCGEQIPEESKFCYHCGHKLTTAETTDTQSTPADTESKDATRAAAASGTGDVVRRKSKKRKKKKKNYHIGYFIFLALLLSLMLWLIYKKANLPEEKPMKSLPSERPQQYLDYTLDDSIGQPLQNDTIYLDEISLLSPELPKIRVSTPVIPTPPADDQWDSGEDDDVQEAEPTYSAPPAPKPVPQVMLKTEQSVRNMLLSNRFVDPTTTDVITFTDNGNVMLKNGEAMTNEMEVNQISGNKAVMYFYDENNNSWDVSLDVSGPHKRLQMMDQEFSSDN